MHWGGRGVGCFVGMKNGLIAERSDFGCGQVSRFSIRWDEAYASGDRCGSEQRMGVGVELLLLMRPEAGAGVGVIALLIWSWLEKKM